MTRKLITAGGSSAAYAVESWCLDHTLAPHAASLLDIAGSYEFVSEEERVELLNNTVAYYVRDSSKLVSGDGKAHEKTSGGNNTSHSVLPHQPFPRSLYTNPSVLHVTPPILLLFFFFFHPCTYVGKGLHKTLITPQIKRSSFFGHFLPLGR